MLGNPGMQVADRRVPYDELEREPPEADGWRPALPGTCLRRLQSPRSLDCDTMCDGRQRDGSCLCDIVNAANDAGVAWSFEIDAELFWVYNGPPLELPVTA